VTRKDRGKAPIPDDPALPWAENEALPAPLFVVWDGPKAVAVACGTGAWAPVR